MFRKWFLIPWPSPGQSNGNVMMLCCCQNRRSKNALLPTFLPSLTEVSRWTVMMFVYKLGTSLENWGLGHIRPALRRHYCDYYHWKLQAAAGSILWTPSWLQPRPEREMKPDPVHWAGDPPGSLSGWITNAQLKISRQFWTPWDLLGCNDIWALVTNSGEVKYNMNALATANTGERGMAVNW